MDPNNLSRPVLRPRALDGRTLQVGTFLELMGLGLMDPIKAPGPEHEQDAFSNVPISPVTPDVPATAKREQGVQDERGHEAQEPLSKQPTERPVLAIAKGDRVGEGTTDTVQSVGSPGEYSLFDRLAAFTEFDQSRRDARKIEPSETLSILWTSVPHMDLRT